MGLQKEILTRLLSVGLFLVVIVSGTWVMLEITQPGQWSQAELRLIQSLWIKNLAPLPQSESNMVADDPRAADFGQRLFFDRRLSVHGQISCATCHQPEQRFTDGLQKARAIGETKRHTPTIVGAAYSPWLFWDGRRDSLWSQAITPLEDSLEHGGNRMQYVRLIGSDDLYRELYENVFGDLPDFSDRNRFPENAAPGTNEDWNSAWQTMLAVDQKLVNQVFADMGKAIAAFERRLLPGPARFDDYVEAIVSGDSKGQQQLFEGDEVRGLQLFIGKASCMQCHNGPLFTNNEFHNTGIISFPEEVPDIGRVDGVRTVMQDAFNCLGEFSNAGENECAELRFARSGLELVGAVRTPSLRNIDGTAPYMHKGQMANLSEVLNHYNEAPLAMIGHNEAEPLNLNQLELRQLEKFLQTLAAPIDAAPKWLKAPSGLETP